MNLDAIADNPELAVGLKPDVLLKLVYRAIAVQQACYTALVVDAKPVERVEDEVLDVQVAARLLGIAPRTLQNGASNHYRSIRVFSKSRRLAFSRRAIEAMQQERGMTPSRSVLAVTGSRRGGI